MINRMILTAVLAAATSLGALTMASAVELHLAHWVPASHPIQKFGIDPWVKAVEEASNGRIHITIFPVQQLGAAPDHYDMTRDGIADIGYVNPGYTAGRSPMASLIEILFLANNAKAGVHAMHEWYLDYVEKEMSEVKLCVMNPHDPGTIHSQTPVHVPADVKGMNVRPANATIARFSCIFWAVRACRSPHRRRARRWPKGRRMPSPFRGTRSTFSASTRRRPITSTYRSTSPCRPW
ncbi:hypothetical protein [Breoghania sp.]|uniref:hypothetical protein n=1 Tax=Breoghania sp. TaxID=2065378 RepID=UPI00263A1443|nr:hypothetical protein [Breoghania sp.]MDJ0931491.1 hypothetical protein [Breoghania sp.]